MEKNTHTQNPLKMHKGNVFLVRLYSDLVSGFSSRSFCSVLLDLFGFAFESYVTIEAYFKSTLTEDVCRCCSCMLFELAFLVV